ncbi:MAG TPA: biotin--[acetyl-CoA-carboxylase] ligase [Gemmatimonadaceae bacterium]|nr:biotin--[acetyl-CoA-carboxylase] ligase [Gemmatimonadaceae bacterium]
MPDVIAATLEGKDAATVARELDLPEVHLFEDVASTMDVAATLGDAGAPAGALVVAASQHAGRGRGRRRWESGAGRGLWLTLLERPNDAKALPVLPLRLGLRMARALDRWAEERIQLKWPNDLYVGGAKLGGILIEARWRDQRLDWVAIGVGINLAAPVGVPGTHLTNSPRRADVLAELIPAMRAAAAARGPLGAGELAAYSARDFARGKRCRTPASGVVVGIAEGGELLVETANGLSRYLTGSLELEG